MGGVRIVTGDWYLVSVCVCVCGLEAFKKVKVLEVGKENNKEKAGKRAKGGGEGLVEWAAGTCM